MANVYKCHGEKHRAMKEEWAGSWGSSLDDNIGEGFSELTMGKNKLGITEKWKGTIGREIFVGRP